MAVAGSTSYFAQIFCSTISLSGVAPSAASQMAAAVPFSAKSVESRPDMIIISSPTMRAATFELRATYCVSFI